MRSAGYSTKADDIAALRADCKDFVSSAQEFGRHASMRPRTYLDHNATAPLRPASHGAMLRALALGGNPSSVHAEGRAARALVEQGRREVARLLGADPGDVVFTSGGTEANATALRPGALRRGARAPARLVTLATEHASVLTGHGFPAEAVMLLPVDGEGRLCLEALRTALAGTPALVSVQAANSETGVVQPIAEIAALVGDADGLLHVDAVQAVCRVPVDLGVWGADALSVSAHKLGGPTGSGALVLASGVELGRLIGGGGQERGLRGGTENVGGIVGFAAACREAGLEAAGGAERVLALRDRTALAIRSLHPDVVIFGEAAARLPNTLAFAVPDIGAETLLMALDLEGIAVSSGSACSSGKVGRSHVLAAMGVRPDLAAGAIRVSLGWSSTDADVDRFVEGFGFVLQRLYDRRRARAA